MKPKNTPDKSINIYDVAKLAGVSIATVSRVMNGSPKVSDKTREKVMSAIEHFDYTPNVFAQGLGQGTMHTVGILVPSISDMYMSSAVAYIEDQLHDEGYDVILSCSGYLSEQKEAHIEMLLSKKIDALVLVGSTYAGSDDETHNTEYINKAAEKVPVFLINGLVAGDNIFCTASNDYQASYDATSHLINSGCRKILFLTDSRSYSAKQKLSGYMQSLNDAGIGSDERYIIHTKNDITISRDLLLSLKISFDGVFATDDAMAVGALKYAAIKHIPVPGKLKVIGYNNSDLCLATEPELSSVDNRVKQVCDDTVGRLVKYIKNDRSIPKKSIVACTLVERRTTDHL